jgi:hypothetical protein
LNTKSNGAIRALRLFLPLNGAYDGPDKAVFVLFRSDNFDAFSYKEYSNDENKKQGSKKPRSGLFLG